MRCFFERNPVCSACAQCRTWYVESLAAPTSRGTRRPFSWRWSIWCVRSSHEGLAVVGDRTQAGFVPWTIPVVDGLDGREGWLRLTEAGRAAARDVPVGAVGDPPDGAVKQWDWPFAQAAARVLVYGTIDWIELGQIHWRVKEVSPDMPIDVVQQRTLELIAELVRGGLVVVGSIDTGAYGFVAWECTVEEALSRIRAVYVDRFDDESAWEWVCLLELTRRGTVLARTIEAQAQR